jgi:hypothetical protein
MPKQEIFFEQESGGRRVEVLKTYDRGYAREALSVKSTRLRRRIYGVLSTLTKVMTLPMFRPFTVHRAKTFYGRNCWKLRVKTGPFCRFSQ